MTGHLDIVMGANTISSRQLKDMDFSDYFAAAEAIYDVCFPKRKKGTFNILRPYG